MGIDWIIQEEAEATMFNIRKEEAEENRRIEEEEYKNQKLFEEYRIKYQENSLKFNLSLKYAHSKYSNLCIGDILSIVGVDRDDDNKLFLNLILGGSHKLMRLSLDIFKDMLLLYPEYTVQDLKPNNLLSVIKNKKVISIEEMVKRENQLFMKLFSPSEITLRVQKIYNLDNIFNNEVPKNKLYLPRCYEGFDIKNSYYEYRKIKAFETKLKLKYKNSVRHLVTIPIFSIG